MATSHFNQAPAQEQENAQLARLHDRITEAASKFYGQPDETHSASKHSVKGLRPPMFGDSTLHLASETVRYSGTDVSYDQSMLLWRVGSDGYGVAILTFREPETTDTSCEVNALHLVGGYGQDTEKVTNPAIRDAIIGYANTMLDSLEHLQVLPPNEA